MKKDERVAIEKDQKKFFDQYAASHEKQHQPVNGYFYDLSVAELRAGFQWLSSCESILDYGCGTGETIKLFLETTKREPTRMVGIDLSEVSVQLARTRYRYEFHVVPDNDLSFLPSSCLDGAYMIGVLHHTDTHRRIFDEISRVLAPGGKFLILDLTKNNPFIELARRAFPYMPKRVKQMFPDDLVVDETIPEKLGVDLEGTLASLHAAGFRVERIEYCNLFHFLFDWGERASRIYLSNTRFRSAYSWLHRIEKRLLGWPLFQRRAGSFVVRAVKAA